MTGLNSLSKTFCQHRYWPSIDSTDTSLELKMGDASSKRGAQVKKTDSFSFQSTKVASRSSVHLHRRANSDALHKWWWSVTSSHKANVTSPHKASVTSPHKVSVTSPHKVCVSSPHKVSVTSHHKASVTSFVGVTTRMTKRTSRLVFPRLVAFFRRAMATFLLWMVAKLPLFWKYKFVII